jgi:hypothetical protein
MKNMVDITGLDPAEVLAALFNAAKTQGVASLFYTPDDMSVDSARELLKKSTYFDYLFGRVMKLEITLESKEIDVRLYNRDNGEDAAQDVINELKVMKDM